MTEKPFLGLSFCLNLSDLLSSKKDVGTLSAIFFKKLYYITNHCHFTIYYLVLVHDNKGIYLHVYEHIISSKNEILKTDSAIWEKIY